MSCFYRLFLTELAKRRNEGKMSVQSDSLGLEEDGLIELGDSIQGLTFHQALNVFLVTTKDGKIRVYDPHSSLKLSDVQLHGEIIFVILIRTFNFCPLISISIWLPRRLVGFPIT